MQRKRLALYGILVTGLLTGLGLIASARDNNPLPNPVGLSLLFQNSAIAPVTLVGGAPRYLQEIDLVATVPTPEDQGIQPLLTNSELASLDWSGVKMVEEDWRPAGDGTFIRQRFYRGARWMERPSLFRVTPTNDAGQAVGQPLIARAGKDDRLGSQDDNFVRRFTARQSAFGCPAQRDCTGATFVAQGLVQLRDSLSAAQNARTIPPEATLARLVTSRGTTLLEIYENPDAYPDLHRIAERFVDWDSTFQTWLVEHFMIVRRTMGVDKTVRALDGFPTVALGARMTKPLFPELWNVRVEMTRAWSREGGYAPGEQRGSACPYSADLRVEA